ncbi:MAG: hypothetical protein MUP21_11155 [Dehalococcoidia bacterium]|nr:hypothetical protein [Dehalococcoidia bacterium]
MHLNYERSHHEDLVPDLSYKECLDIVRSLETVKKLHLRNSPIIEKIAVLMQQNRVRDLTWLSQLIEDTADRVLGESRLSSMIAEHPTPAH